jgi:Transposase DDE domain
MHNHAPELSKPQVKIPRKDFQTKDKSFALPSLFRLGLDPEEIGRIALRSGFTKRRPRKIEPSNFLQALVVMTVSTAFSMRAFAILLGLFSHNVVSKVAVFLRMKPAVIDFVREALFNSVSATSRLKEEIGKGVFAFSRRVLLQDSTILSLPPKLAVCFPGSKNQSGKTSASVKLQTTYNALTETFVSFQLTPYRCNDQCASSFILDIIRERDLVIRDLGYSSLRVFKTIGEKKAFYLSRYSHKIALFHPSGKRQFAEREIPPFRKGGPGGILDNLLKIPLNPPLEKGDFDGISALSKGPAVREIASMLTPVPCERALREGK